MNPVNPNGVKAQSGLSRKMLGRAEYDKQLRILKAIAEGRDPIVRPRWNGMKDLKIMGRAAYMAKWRAMRKTK